MVLLQHLYNALEVLYSYSVIELLQHARIISYMAWLGALTLLGAKLFWKPLDQATTYGKLLHSRSEAGSVPIDTSKAKKESPPTQHSPSPATSKPSADTTPTSWITTRFAFTSSYILGWIWTMCLIIAAFALIYFFLFSAASPTPRSCPSLPMARDMVIKDVIETTVTDTSGEISTRKVLTTKQECSECDSNPLLTVPPILDTRSLAVRRHNSPLYHQSICSMKTRWQQDGDFGTIFTSETLWWLILEALSNMWIFRLTFLSAMVLVHMSRRSIECVFVHVFSPRPLGLHNLLLMWAYYAFMPLALFLELVVEVLEGVVSPTPVRFSLSGMFSVGIAIELFLLASVLQFSSHRILALLRQPSEANKSARAQGSAPSYAYTVPKGGAFEYVSCPHYLAELLIYTSFAIVSRGTPGSLLLLAFVSITMIMQSVKSHEWYRKNFAAQKLGNRTAIIPFLL